MKINQLYIRVNTACDIFEFSKSFSEKLNVITSFTNTKGKSTIGEAILFCLGLEEILGNKNEQALKPVLRTKIEKDNEEHAVIQSDIYLEIENKNNEVITILRSPKNNSRNVKLVSVYNSDLDCVLSGGCDYKDYYVHDGGAAQNEKGFHFFLANFIGFTLPMVATYGGSSVPLYMQTLASCFYIEQKRGWTNILSTLPTYYKIKEVKRRVIEYVLGLSVLETEKEYSIAKIKLKAKKSEWEEKVKALNFKIQSKPGLSIKGLNVKPHIITQSELINIYYNDEEGQSFRIEDKIEQINFLLKELNNIKEPTVENRSNSLKQELIELNRLIEEFSLKRSDANQEYVIEKDQLDSILTRIGSIDKDLEKNKDLKKLMNLGSFENTSLSHSKCPTCGNSIDDTLFEQDTELKIMSIDASIKYLANEKKMLEYSQVAQRKLICSIKTLIFQYDERISNISERLRIVKSDLISNNKAISESHIQRIVDLELEKKRISEIILDSNRLWLELDQIGKEWAQAKDDFIKIPKDYLTQNDKIIIKTLNKEFKDLLVDFNFGSTTIGNINIDKYNYLPSIEKYDLQSDSSASDTVRIVWAYIVALQKVARQYGKSFGFLFMDEPAQQNTDIKDAKELLKKLYELSEVQQVFVFYKLEKNDGVLDVLVDKEYKRIHADDFIISATKITN